jgi:hypothetical protein
MRRSSALFLLAVPVLVLPLLAVNGADKTSTPPKLDARQAQTEAPAYTEDGKLRMPAAYREWVYLTTGLDMSYVPKPGMAGHSMFDNVFVNPGSYRSFQQTGTWPDGTTLVLEVRGAETGTSINKRGHTQSSEVMGLEVHVKDAKLPGGWGFFEFDGPNPAKLVARPADCYACHEGHAAVDTTFVQFYPTLLPLAKEKNTLSPAYVKENATAATNP